MRRLSVSASVVDPPWKRRGRGRPLMHRLRDQATSRFDLLRPDLDSCVIPAPSHGRWQRQSMTAEPAADPLREDQDHE